jgi:hypothetical protein
MYRDQLKAKFFIREIQKPTIVIGTMLGLFMFIIGIGASMYGFSKEMYLITPVGNFLDTTSVGFSYIGAGFIIFGLFSIGILVLGSVANAMLTLAHKECEDYHAFIAEKNLEHEYKEYLIKNNLAYDEEKADWRSEFSELVPKYKRKIRLE